LLVTGVCAKTLLEIYLNLKINDINQKRQKFDIKIFRESKFIDYDFMKRGLKLLKTSPFSSNKRIYYWFSIAYTNVCSLV
jgi:hypothetical protein